MNKGTHPYSIFVLTSIFISLLVISMLLYLMDVCRIYFRPHACIKITIRSWKLITNIVWILYWYFVIINNIILACFEPTKMKNVDLCVMDSSSWNAKNDLINDLKSTKQESKGIFRCSNKRFEWYNTNKCVNIVVIGSIIQFLEFSWCICRIDMQCKRATSLFCSNEIPQ